MNTGHIRPAEQVQAPLPHDLPFCRNPCLEIHRIEANLLLADPGTGTTRSLDPFAASVWYLLKDPTTIGEAVITLQRAFPDLDPSRVRSDVERLFHELQAAKMILPEYRKTG